MKKNNIIFSISIAICLFFGGTAQAQTQKNEAAIKQDIREKAMQVIQKGYEKYASCSSQDYQYEFTRLFVNSDAVVYNDLLGLSSERTLPIGKYARMLGEGGVRQTIVTISGISILDEPYQEKGKWKIDLGFNKRMSYYDACGIYFNSYDFYHADYNLEATLVYDDVDGQCRIESIKGSVDSYAELPDEYFVFKQTDERDRNLYYRRTPLRFNSGNQVLLEGTFDPTAFSHANPKVRQLFPKINDCNIATMSYKDDSKISTKRVATSDTKMAAKIHLGLPMGDAFKVDGVDNAKSSGFSFGVDFSYLLSDLGAFRPSIAAGLGFSSMNIKDLGVTKINKTIDATDIDGDKYTRIYKGLSLNQKVTLSELNIPVYFDAEYMLHEIFSVYADLGLKFNFVMSKSIETESASVESISGNYSQYGGLVFDEDWDKITGSKHGFTKTHKELKDVGDGDLEGVSGMTFDILAGVGVRINIPNSSVAIDLGAKYVMGLSDIISNDSKSSDDVKINYTFDKDESFDISQSIKSVKRQSLFVRAGVIIKF